MYLSPLHPRGEDLTKLLELGAKSAACRRGHSSSLADGHRGHGPKRQRVDSIYELIATNNIQSSLDMEVFANKEMSAGRPAVAEFCTRSGHRLDQYIANARRVMDAPKSLEEKALTLMGKLLRAAESLTCVCGGSWIPGALQILQRNHIDQNQFIDALCRALELGAKRGVNVGLVGRAGSGKSSLIEPLDQIFKAAGKPQKGSTFPLSNTIGCDVLLWQDYKHHEPTVSFDDLLSYLVGESVDVRIPGEKNVKVRNRAPLIYSGRQAISSRFEDPSERCDYDEMMTERFTLFRFPTPIPKTQRRPDHPHCGKCCAQFYLKIGLAGSPSGPRAATDSSAAMASVSCEPCASPLPDSFSQLATLIDWRNAGHLSDAEFAAAKRQLGL